MKRRALLRGLGGIALISALMAGSIPASGHPERRAPPVGPTALTAGEWAAVQASVSLLTSRSERVIVFADGFEST